MRKRDDIPTVPHTLPLRAPARLAQYKAKAAELDAIAAKHGNADRVTDWRTCRYQTFAAPGGGGAWQTEENLADGGSRPYRGSACDRAYYCDHWPRDWRIVGSASDVLRAEGRPRAADECAWYADAFGGSVIVGAVLQLPARNGYCGYVPATYNTDCAGVTVYPCDRHETKEEAARAAGEFARATAERDREWRARDDARQSVDDARTEIRTARAEHSALVREMQTARTTGIRADAICRALHARLAALRDDVREARRAIAAAVENYGPAILGGA
ncbi:MAG: hypothetical protein KAY22_05585 [Rhizorhabdus sp.]|uniref:hypothetical protein n=1 Tax=Rhizorhabdus sp. TaxID=1968843 RepID=UPI001B598E6A|nr:hypothetical protein [Rhizorhabdus sp.]MBP8231757.1 hypothetical protein [Rhizorhabdus sp.]